MILLRIVNILIIALAVGSCATSEKMLVSEKNLPYFYQTAPDGTNQHESIIRLTNENGFFCTGFVIDGNYALTAAHCVENSFGGINTQDIFIYSSLYYSTGVVAKAVSIDKYRDIALIKGNFKSFKAQPVDFYGTHVKYQQKMISCGYPSGMLPKFCATLEHVGNNYFKFRTKGGPIYKGMSGGVVVDAETGIAIGVNSAVDEDTVIIGPLVGALRTLGFGQ